MRHVCIPVGLGSARSDLPHETHAFYHGQFIETGDTPTLSTLISCICGAATDKGTEHGMPESGSVKFGDFFPHFVPMDFDKEAPMEGSDSESIEDEAVPDLELDDGCVVDDIDFNRMAEDEDTTDKTTRSMGQSTQMRS